MLFMEGSREVAVKIHSILKNPWLQLNSRKSFSLTSSEPIIFQSHQCSFVFAELPVKRGEFFRLTSAWAVQKLLSLWNMFWQTWILIRHRWFFIHWRLEPKSKRWQSSILLIFFSHFAKLNQQMLALTFLSLTSRKGCSYWINHFQPDEEAYTSSQVWDADKDMHSL